MRIKTVSSALKNGGKWMFHVCVCVVCFVRPYGNYTLREMEVELASIKAGDKARVEGEYFSQY
jgi:hypothetical protein